MVFDLLQSIYSSILLIIENLHYFGIYFGMTIESSFFPFPSEAILIPAGSLIKKGSMDLVLVFFLSVLGSLTGALINYSIALFIGRKGVERLVSKYGHFLFIKQESLKKSDR
jgi:membrane protein DedA with SNARE-associated domain